MELIEKYRLVLLQLKKYSDNELVLIEGKTLNIEEELNNLSSKKWVEVKTVEFWTSEDGDSSGEHKRTHTLKVDANCTNLKEECEKVLRKQEPRLNFHKITSYKFM